MVSVNNDISKLDHHEQVNYHQISKKKRITTQKSRVKAVIQQQIKAEAIVNMILEQEVRLKGRCCAIIVGRLDILNQLNST